jgi:hypothetical protein
MRRWLRSELPLLVMVVYLPRIQILVGQSWVGTTLKGWPFGLSGRGSDALNFSTSRNHDDSKAVEFAGKDIETWFCDAITR